MIDLVVQLVAGFAFPLLANFFFQLGAEFLFGFYFAIREQLRIKFFVQFLFFNQAYFSNQQLKVAVVSGGFINA